MDRPFNIFVAQCTSLVKNHHHARNSGTTTFVFEWESMNALITLALNALNCPDAFFSSLRE
jgi:hypothetical protein